MLIRFVYLDKPTLAGYVAQLDGGLIAETKVRLVKKGSAGGKVNLKLLGVTGDRSNENEHFWTMTFPPEAQFQRLLAVANDSPDTIDWIDVVDADRDYASAQVGEVIAWECDVDIAGASRLMARGGGGAQLLGIMGAAAAVGGAGVRMGRQSIPPEQAAVLESQAQMAQRLIDSMDIKRIAVCKDSAITDWSVFGALHNEHLLVDDINNERLIVIGKIKRKVRRGESRLLVNTEAMQLTQTINAPKNDKVEAQKKDNQIVGPALELDILAIYR